MHVQYSIGNFYNCYVHIIYTYMEEWIITGKSAKFATLISSKEGKTAICMCFFDDLMIFSILDDWSLFNRITVPQLR